MSTELMWYATKLTTNSHTPGSIHVKRYFDQGDLDEARESTFVAQVAGPFAAESRQEAVAIAWRKLT